ncbi:hypothetical protein ACFLVG_05300 [Chloroflexota bacterium]
MNSIEELIIKLGNKNRCIRQQAESLGYLGGGNMVAERMIRSTLKNAEDGI